LREGYCMCPIAESGLPGLSRTFCECSGGYVKEGLEGATGMTVVGIDVFESLLRGGKDCRFKAVLKAYRDTLNTMIGIVRTNLAAGRTVDQMVQDDVLKAYKARCSLLDFLTPDTLIPRVVTALQQGTLK
jgi:hypothetical protein